MGGYCFDILAKLTGKKLTVSSVRVKKFCATTEFDAKKSTFIWIQSSIYAWGRPCSHS